MRGHQTYMAGKSDGFLKSFLKWKESGAALCHIFVTAGVFPGPTPNQPTGTMRMWIWKRSTSLFNHKAGNTASIPHNSLVLVGSGSPELRVQTTQLNLPPLFGSFHQSYQMVHPRNPSECKEINYLIIKESNQPGLLIDNKRQGFSFYFLINKKRTQLIIIHY